MSSKNIKNSSTKRPKGAAWHSVPGFAHIGTVREIEEYLFLKNELRVLYMHMPGSGSVTVNIVYGVGSRHEERGKTGLAHLLEHMLFKPTRDRNGKRVEPPRYVHLQNEGASLNASTWNDRTNYYFSMPASYLSDILFTEAERMRGLIIEEREFVPERQNVLSEFEMYADRPHMALESAVASAAFTSHGYGHDTIGFRSDIASCTTEDLRHFYDTYYWPDNAHVVVIGDVSRTEVLTEIKKHFSHIEKSPRPFPHGSFEEPRQEGLRTVEIVRENPISIVMVAFKAPHGREKAWVYSELALNHLAGGKLSILHKSLIETQKASAVSPFIYPTHDSYLMGIQATVSQGHTVEEIRDCILAEIAAFKKQKLSKEILKRLKRVQSTSMLFDRDGTNSIARELTEYIAMGDWKRYYSMLEDINTATAGQIQAVAREYFLDTQCTIGMFRGT